MAVLRDLHQDVTDERFRTAVVLGIASIPFTVGVNWILAPDTTEATPILIACVLSGYLYESRSVSTARAGMLTGFVGGIPIVVRNSWTAFTDVWEYLIVIHAVSNSVILATVSVGVALLAVVVMPVVLMVVGWIGGVVGGWVNERVDSARLFSSKS
jgi:hypothetical protein